MKDFPKMSSNMIFQGLIYVNGNVLTSKQIVRIGAREIELIAGDWNGFVGIGIQYISLPASRMFLNYY